LESDATIAAETSIRVSNASGKLVILTIVAVALAAAGTSWWFRYKATHRAASFWGPEGSQMIRDAPRVLLTRTPLSAPSLTRDISTAPGITHLRNALLEDRSFKWGQGISIAPKGGSWTLEFSTPASGEPFAILFSTDCRAAKAIGDDGAKKEWQVSTEPISKGLREVFDELTSEVATQER
jgi:hypothetical protein